MAEAENLLTGAAIYRTITFSKLGRATSGLFTKRNENVPAMNNERSHTHPIRRQHFHQLFRDIVRRLNHQWTKALRWLHMNMAPVQEKLSAV